MAIPFNLLTTAAECDEAFAYAQQQDAALAREAIEEGFEMDDTAESAKKVKDALTSAEASIAFLTPYIATLADDDDNKRKRLNELRQATDRRDNMLARRSGRPVDQVKQALTLERIAADRLKVQQFMADVTAHKATL